MLELFLHVVKPEQLVFTALLEGYELLIQMLVLLVDLLGDCFRMFAHKGTCLLHHDWPHVFQLLVIAQHDLLQLFLE